MSLDDAGFLRPEIITADPNQAHERLDYEAFQATCPGVNVTAPDPGEGSTHPIFGRYQQAWQGWALDKTLRNRGASGGVLTALTKWLLESGQASSIVGSRGSKNEPLRTEPLLITDPQQATLLAGSRYAPVANLDEPSSTHADALVLKPCEASALAQYHSWRGTPKQEIPVVLSFFCAGTPSQRATEDLVETLGFDKSNVEEIRYRGLGCPGRFRVRSKDGTERTTSYDESWGHHLGRDLQTRCKICVDGTGSHADIAVGDFWPTDPLGYPIFDESEGNSVIIGRTARGRDLLLKAFEARVIALEPIDLRQVEASQPLQTERRYTLAGRMAGRLAAGQKNPRYRGYSLARLALRNPYSNMRAAAGNFLRARGIKT